MKYSINKLIYFLLDLTGAGETLSRRKSFKKTLRESFRRLRKGRSTRNNPTSGAPPPNVQVRIQLYRRKENTKYNSAFIG